MSKDTKKREGNKRRHQRMKARRMAAGMCIRCKQPAIDGIQKCERHRDLDNKSGIEQNRKHREKRLKYWAAYNQQRLEQKREYAREYGRAHKEEISAYKKTIRDVENERKRSPEYKAKRNALRREKRRTDPVWAITERLRKRVGRAIRDYATGHKSKRTAELIGCSMEFLMKHIESLFLPGMTWENRNLWHLDHIRPCKSFQLDDPEQQKLCFHYTNLQPLWAKDNIRKHAKTAGA